MTKSFIGDKTLIHLSANSTDIIFILVTESIYFGVPNNNGRKRQYAKTSANVKIEYIANSEKLAELNSFASSVI